MLQRALTGYAPQRNNQRQRRRDEHNTQLELGRQLQPILNDRPHVVAGGVARVITGVDLDLQHTGNGVHGREDGAQQEGEEHKGGSAHDLPPQLPACSPVFVVHVAQGGAHAASAGDADNGERQDDDEQTATSQNCCTDPA